MPYLTDFQCDIFISYARVNNRTVDDQPGWVTQFEKHLDVELSSLIGDDGRLKIWRDRAIEGNQEFDQTIRDAIKGSALFLALNSSGYVNSEYCLKELNWFREKAEEESYGLTVGDRRRVFNLLLQNIHFQKWPAEFSGISGSKFNDAEGQEDIGFPSEPGQPPFRSQLRKLAQEIFKTLEAMRERSTTPVKKEQVRAQEPRQPEDGKAAIFLADTTDALDTLRSRLENDLRAAGLSVASKVPPPHESKMHKEMAIEKMKGAILSVHLLGGLPGHQIFDAPGSYYPQEQVEVGLQHARSQLIWVQPGLDVQSVENTRYRDLLDRLVNGAREEGAYQLNRESQTMLASEIIERVKQLTAPPPPPNLTVLLNTHFKDRPHTYDLVRYLDERNIDYQICRELDDPQGNMNIFVEMLKQASALVIVFGEVAEEWVRERLAVALQTAINERCNLRACGIYLAPPSKKNASLQFNRGFLNIQLMDNSETFDPETLRPILV